MKNYGKKSWMIADCFYDSHFNKQVSHEAVCVLNTTDTDATITMTLYFEDREPAYGYIAKCGAGRTHHIRMDKLISKDGQPVPVDTPYVVLVESDVNVVVQYSRLDTAQAEMALMTTIAYPLD
jgi:hypothetical protein